MTLLRFVVVAVVSVSMIFIGRWVIGPQQQETMTKEQYLNLAVKNCKGELGSELCTCFYTRMLNEKGVKGTMKFDVDAARNPDAEFDDYLLEVLDGCL